MKHNLNLTIRRSVLIFSTILFYYIENTSAQEVEYDRHKCIIESEHLDVEIPRDYNRKQVFTPTGGRKMTVTATYLITGREGDIYTEVEIPYQKGDEVTIHYAHIEDMNGNVIRKLRNRDVKETQAVSSGSMYEDDFIKYFQLLHNIHPYRLKYSYSVTHNKYLHLLKATEGVLPTQNSVVTLTVPDNMKGIHMRYENVAEPEITESNGMVKYTWRYSYKPPKPETMPYRGSRGIPEITVTSDEFKYGIKGSMASWESFGNWLYALNEGLDELPGYEKAAITKLLAGVEDDMEKMKILYRYLQDYNRYVNVSIDIGGMKSYPASYVCANRYGDCKALTTYMKAMLKYIGIESYTAAVWLGDTHPEVRDDFPESASNHVINVIPYKGDTIYLECTSKNDPFGYIHSKIQGRKALLTKKSGSHLIDIPAMQPEDVKCSYSYNIKIDGDGNATVHTVNMMRGINYEWLNSVANSVDKSYRDKLIRDLLYSGNMELQSYRININDRILPEASLIADFKIMGLSRIYGKNVVVSNFPIHLPLFEHPDKRQSSVEISTPVYKEYVVVYDIPSIRLGSLPDPVKIESKYGTYEIRYSADSDGKLVIHKAIMLNTGIYPIEEYRDFYNFISQVKKEEKTKLNINIL